VISARIVAGDRLQISVRDTGLGASERALTQGREHGVGLSNVERRLRTHYGDQASFSVRSTLGAGTTVEMSLPVNPARAANNAAVA
jgi:sensor histidine kinase YesM